MLSTRYRVAERINAEVNADTRYRPDIDRYGQPEFWTCADGEGDCEDYALEKRRRLLAAGFPLEAMRLAVVFTETAAGRRALGWKQAGLDVMGDHAVLVVSVPEGDWILDNRFPGPMALRASGYVIDRLQVAGKNAWEHGE